MHKRAQGLSVSTIIIALVALVVLVVLIAIFTGFFGNFAGEVDSCATRGGTCAPNGDEAKCTLITRFGDEGEPVGDETEECELNNGNTGFCCPAGYILDTS